MDEDGKRRSAGLQIQKLASSHSEGPQGPQQPGWGERSAVCPMWIAFGKPNRDMPRNKPSAKWRQMKADQKIMSKSGSDKGTGIVPTRRRCDGKHHYTFHTNIADATE